MNWLEEVQNNLKKKNKILFSKSSEYLQDLMQLINEQNHKTMVLWAFEFAEETVRKLHDSYPDDNRPENAVATAKLWASGRVKMPEAQRAILQVHAMAKEIHSPEDIALCHAVGQACGTVHAVGHAIGFPIYDLTSLIRKHGIEACQEQVEQRKQQYMDRIFYWRNNYQNWPQEWADFMKED